MENKVRALIVKLENENKDRIIALNDKDCPKYSYTVLVHKYNNTLDIIKQLNEVLLS